LYFIIKASACLVVLACCSAKYTYKTGMWCPLYTNFGVVRIGLAIEVGLVAVGQCASVT